LNTNQLTQQALSCTLCSASLKHSPNPIFIWPPRPKVILISQAPGRLAHESNIAWNDASGERLRAWLGVDRTQFYDMGVFAVLPMSFCFPGYKNGADAAPLKPCAPLWHPKFLSQVDSAFIIYIGRYAQKAYLPSYASLTDAVADFKGLLPNRAALPHPAGRNNRWVSKNGWFGSQFVPLVRERIQAYF